MSTMKDLTGMKFGHLTVLFRIETNKKGPIKYAVECDCENHTHKVVDGASLVAGRTRSCGCASKELAKATRADTPHSGGYGLSGTKLYKAWSKLKGRCTNEKLSDYASYGGRGIKIAEEWMEFYPFYVWAMDNGYEEGMYLTRRDTDGDFTPDNCFWSRDRKLLVRNTKRSRMITYKDEEHPVSEWSRIVDIDEAAIRWRLNKGMSSEKALFMKKGSSDLNGLRDHKGFLVLCKKDGIELGPKTLKHRE